jgi:hypothetical protein
LRVGAPRDVTTTPAFFVHEHRDVVLDLQTQAAA